MYQDKRHILIRDTVALLGFLLFMFMYGNAGAVALSASSYVYGSDIAIQAVTDASNRLTIYNLAYTDTKFCQTTKQEVDEIGSVKLTCFGEYNNFEEGSYSIIESSAAGLVCNRLSYEECKAHPSFLNEFLFTFTPPHVTAVVGSVSAPGGGGGGGGPTAYRPEVSISSPARHQLFSNFVKIYYQATDQNDTAEKAMLGLGDASVSLYYSETSDTRKKILIARGLPPVGSYVWDAKNIEESDTYRIVVEATDNSGEIGEAVSEEFSLDHVTPVFTVRADPPVTSGENVRISVESTKELAEPPSVTVRQTDFRAVDLGMTGTSTLFEGIYQVVRGYDGPAEITVSGKDLFGNISTTTVSGGQFSVGVRPPPQPTLTYPLNNDLVTAGVTAVRGRMRKDTTAFLSVDGKQISYTKPDASGNFSFENVPLRADFNNGVHFITVTSRDLAGNVSDPATVAVKFNIAPALTIASPREGETVGTTTTISISAVDKNRDKLSFSYELSADGGTSWNVIEEKTSATSIKWRSEEVPDGTYLVRVTASDGIAKTSAVSGKFIVKNSSSRVSFSDGSKTVTNTKNYSLSGLATASSEPAGLRITSIDYSLTAGKEWNPARATDGTFDGPEEYFTAEFRDLAEGTYAIQVRAEDTRGIYGVATKQLVVDFGPPGAPEVSSPVAGSLISDAMDENPKLVGVQISVRGRAEAGSTITATSSGLATTVIVDETGHFVLHDITLRSHGANTVELVALDRALNKSAVATISYVYNNPPVVAFLAPRKDRAVGGKFLVQLEVRDPDLDVVKELLVSYARSKDSPYAVIAKNPRDNQFVWDVTDFKETSGYLLKAEATDGISKSSVVNSIYIDNTPPKITLSDVPEQKSEKKFMLTAKGSAEDTVSGVEYVEYSIDGEHWFKALITKGYLTKQVEFSVKHPLELHDGTYNFSIRAVDRAGNSSEPVVRIITVDSTPPRMGNYTISHGSVSLIPTNDRFTVPVGSELGFAISLEADTREAELHIGTTTCPLVSDGGLWKAVCVPDVIGSEKLLLSAYDTKGNGVEGKEIGVLDVVRKGSVGTFASGSAQGSIQNVLVFDREDGNTRVFGETISGADISVRVWSPDRQSFVLWPGSSYGLRNPVVTQDDGSYSLLLPEGRYQIIVEKPGYVGIETAEFILEQPRFIITDFYMRKREGIRGALENLLEKVSLF